MFVCNRTLFLTLVLAAGLIATGCSDDSGKGNNGSMDNGDNGADGDNDLEPGDGGGDGVADGMDVPPGDTGGDGSDMPPGDAAGDVGGDISRQDYCMGSGPPILIGGGGQTEVCTGEIAQVTFRYAICSCSDLTFTDEVFTDAFDSSQGMYMPGGSGGAIGTNGNLTASNKLTVGGSLLAGGVGGMDIADETAVDLELRDNGGLFGGGTMDVGLDAFINGDVDMGTITVGGSLYLPTGATVQGGNPTLVRQPVSVPPPCDCATNQLVDIAGFVDHYTVNNDNAEVGLDPDALANVNGPTTLELDCGRFYLSGISATSDVTITARDRTALFIGGDIDTTSKFTIQLEPGAELDLFIAGSFTATDEVDLGSIRNPANVRLYLGTNETITWSNKFSIGGNIYAPFATLEITDAVDIYGSVFVNELVATNKLNVHYDRAILTAGENCDPPPMPMPGDMDMSMDIPNVPQACGDCRDCGNQACINGECGDCQTSADCCSPLLCVDGSCIILN